MTNDVKGKVALITGGTGTLGTMLVSRFLESGSIVCVPFHSEQGLSTLQSTFGKDIVTLRADFTEEKDVVALYERIVALHRRIDIVVNTIGGYLPPKPFTEVTRDEWERLMALNLTSAFLSTREALRYMAGQSYGRIVNISAMAGVRPLQGRIPYAISKSSVSLLTEMVAQEVKARGITVNAIAPSIILSSSARSSGDQPEAAQGVTSDEIAAIVLSLCSQAAGAVTGTTIRMP